MREKNSGGINFECLRKITEQKNDQSVVYGSLLSSINI
jgi:hypothetical protein